ncbi:MAG: M23 family metallopeptidase [Candidatus Binataceae bacterium]|nr:M23 family metallopeptidase [Candidatus Binataceae bacterium]
MTLIFAVGAAAILLMLRVGGRPTVPVPGHLKAGKIQTQSLFFVESAQPAPQAVTISTMLDRTAPVTRYLEDAGLRAEDALRWAELFHNKARSNLMLAGHALTLYKDPDTGALRGFRYNADYHRAIMELGLGESVIKVWQMPIQYELRPVLVAFPVQGDFRRAAARHGIPGQIVSALEKAFDSRHPLNRLEPGSTVKLIYQEKVSRDGTWRLPTGLEAAQLGLSNGKTLDAFAFSDGHSNAHLYDEHGRSLEAQTLRFPVNFDYISSGFTYSRYHPLLHIYRPHLGVDLATRYGEPVKAVADGRVTTAGWCGQLGRCIRIEHPGDIATIYGHLSRIQSTVQPGVQVHAGDVIGKVGSSGLSTGPHLHFAVESGDKFVNPLTEHLGENHPISPGRRALFDDMKQRYEAALNNLPDSGLDRLEEADTVDQNPAVQAASAASATAKPGVSPAPTHRHHHHRHWHTMRAAAEGDAYGGM